MDLSKKATLTYFQKAILLLVAYSILNSCTQEKLSPGICLSFDDRSINEWFELRDIFLENDVRATFFITQLDSISKSEIAKLKVLEAEGHEIGFHGVHHVLSEHYIKENSYADYLNYEMNPGLV